MIRFREGERVLLMSVGTHASEEFVETIKRKQREIKEAGYALWGYGGSLGKPTGKLLQDFLNGATDTIEVLMRPTNSSHNGDANRADEFSVDGINWDTIPDSINCRGSEWALCLDRLQVVDEAFNPNEFRVVGGVSNGKVGSVFRTRGQADQLRLEFVGGDVEPDFEPIWVRARLVSPYAVLVRDRPQGSGDSSNSRA